MVVALFLGSVLAVALPPFCLIFAAHKFVKLIVVSLPFPFFILPPVVLVPLSAAVLLPLLLVAFRLPSSGQSGSCSGETQYIIVTQSF